MILSGIRLEQVTVMRLKLKILRLSFKFTRKKENETKFQKVIFGFQIPNPKPLSNL